jgi:hypothetical protein
MALITLGEAARRTDASREKLDEWIKLGLLAVHARPVNPPPGGAEPTQTEPCVDEEDLFDVAESEGWWEVSVESWDSEEVE